MRLVEPEDAVSVVLEQEAPDVDEVHRVTFGKGERLAREPAHSLPESEVEAFQAVGRPLFLLLVELLWGHNQSISGPGIGKSAAAFVVLRHLVPQLLACRGGVVAWHPRHDLASSAAQRHMNPHLVLLAGHIRPELIQLQLIAFLSGQERLLQLLLRGRTAPLFTVFF